MVLRARFPHWHDTYEKVKSVLHENGHEGYNAQCVAIYCSLASEEGTSPLEYIKSDECFYFLMYDHKTPSKILNSFIEAGMKIVMKNYLSQIQKLESDAVFMEKLKSEELIQKNKYRRVEMPEDFDFHGHDKYRVMAYCSFKGVGLDPVEFVKSGRFLDELLEEHQEPTGFLQSLGYALFSKSRLVVRLEKISKEYQTAFENIENDLEFVKELERRNYFSV